MPGSLVSVVIPVYNMAHCVAEAIESVFDQSFSDLEVIIADDGSTDNLAKAIQKFGDQVRVIRQENRGPSVARNSGIRAAQGEYIAFLDADDIWKPEKLEKQIAAMQLSEDIGLVTCGYKKVHALSGDTIETMVRENYPDRAALLEALSLAQILPASASGALLRRECFDEAGLFDESLRVAEDWDMWLRVAKRFEVRFVEEPLVILRDGDAKPAYRTLRFEENSVRAMIDRTVPGRFRRRSYAALYLYLGSNYLSQNNKARGIPKILKSILLSPFPIYPSDPSDRYKYPRTNRYYLLVKSFFPASFVGFVKRLVRPSTP